MAHPELNPFGLPLTILGAAAYQLAGYPARASSLAGREASEEQDAPLVRLLVSGHFDALLLLAAQVAADTLIDGLDERQSTRDQAFGDQRTEIIAGELASALGVVCSALRWGDESRLELARRKLDAVAPAASAIVDPYSWLVLRLSTDFARRVLNDSLREALTPIGMRMGDQGRAAMERYVRTAYRAKQSLVWPSQQRGIDKLSSNRSFALCTPTGSGKTRVAEVALLEGLFADSTSDEHPALCLYIVPTRALAAEVEGKLGRILTLAGGARAVTVTGLYGGLDWGPTDEWLSSDEPTVLICTQEKAETLVRFLGGALFERLKLVIIDEAHEVQCATNPDELVRSESRALRLESLVTRLKSRRPDATFIAISAVARHLERPLAQWVSRGVETDSVTVAYRSTRQVVGSLLCRQGGRTRIDYRLLDGEELNVATRDEAPFVPDPFRPMPPAPGLEGPQQVLASYALWAAMQLASGDGSRGSQAVLVSVTEGIANFTAWWLRLLSEVWVGEGLPTFFRPPTDHRRRALWARATSTCSDLFGDSSREYQLLERGIVVHHGRMPGRLPRLLTELISEQVSRIVLATSTLSQGVNLPVETVLVPRLERFDRNTGGPMPISGREFANLIGRAGRPGVATEGQALVLLPGFGAGRTRAQRAYESVIGELTASASAREPARSGLAELIEQVASRWPGDDEDEFFAWLEQTAPINIERSSPHWDAAQALDALDAVLLAVDEESSEVEIELQLRKFWQESFARYVRGQEGLLEEILVRRGVALQTHVYPDASIRRRYYMTCLPPIDAEALFGSLAQVLAHLRTAQDYWQWDDVMRYRYIERTVELVTTIPRFEIASQIGGSRATWRDALTWWLRVPGFEARPTVAQIGVWHDYLQRELRYRFTWGLGSVLALALEEQPEAGALPSWEEADLPWVAVWIKDLLTWGTLDPVAAFLLARGGIDTRDEAENLAQEYYEAWEGHGDRFDPTAIRRWTQGLRIRASDAFTPGPSEIAVELAPALADSRRDESWRVVPDVHGLAVRWLDPAGFELARCPIPDNWQRTWSLDYDYRLEPARRAVRATRYV